MDMETCCWEQFMVAVKQADRHQQKRPEEEPRPETKIEDPDRVRQGLIVQI